MVQQSIERAGTALDLACAGIGVGLSHPIRIAILRLLCERGELCSCEIEPCFEVDPSGVSRHLSALRDAGLIVSRRDGVRILHRTASPAVVELLAVADRIAARADAAEQARRERREAQYRTEVRRRDRI
ncbi:MAG: metalloregulator ArsR/SmtB family transcription factor [Thermotogota bacterium]